MSAARWLAGIIASVVAAFVATTIISQSIESSIELRSSQLITNAMPSIQTLSSTRGDLRRLENDIERYATADPSQATELRNRIAGERDHVAADLASYGALPLFPGEPALHERAEADFKSLAAELANYLASPSAVGVSRVHRELDMFDRAIEDIISFDASEGQRLGRDIERIHEHTRTTAALLDVVSVALAIVGLILAVRQVYRAARAHAAERKAHEKREAELASQNEALGQFAGRVAHDVLSPLATASLSFDLIRQLELDRAEVKRATDLGAGAIGRVHTLVDDLLAFSRAGGQPEPGVATPIAPVMTDVTVEIREQARERDIELCVASVAGGSVACSSGVLTSVITNLLRNAIKYMGDATERRVELRVSDAANRWRFEVEDTGPGIPPEQQQRIFEPYVQLARRSAGIGLGLATVDRLVRAHAGAVGVISPAAAGRGCVFWFELPKA